MVLERSNQAEHDRLHVTPSCAPIGGLHDEQRGFDRSFTIKLGRRLAKQFRNATIVELPGAKTFVSLDEPDRLADEIAAIMPARIE